MTAPELMADLWDAGFRLSLEGDRLRVSAPGPAATPEIVALIRRHKADFLDFIRWTREPGEAVPGTVPAASKGDIA